MIKIFLIGMPGSGKTTLGRELAEKLKIRFTDLDEEIEKTEKSSINEIFANSGEDYFRHLEQRILRNVIRENDSFVLATGGGAACFFNNLDEMKEAGITVFLKVSAKELFERLKSQIAHRPLLKEKSENELLKEIEEKLNKRSRFYLASDVVVEGDDIRAEDLINCIKRKNLL